MTHQKILAMLEGCSAQKPMQFDDLVKASGLLPDTLKQVLVHMAHSVPPSINRATVTKDGRAQMMIWPTGVVSHRAGPQGIIINSAKHIQQQLTHSLAETMRKPATNMQPNAAKVKPTASIMQSTKETKVSKSNCGPGRPSEINTTLHNIVSGQPGIGREELLSRAAKQLPGEEMERIKKTLSNMTHVTKKLRSEGDRQNLTYYHAGSAPSAPAKNAAKPAAAKRPTCTKSQTAGDDEFSIMLSESGNLHVSTGVSTVVLNCKQAERLHRFIGRINMDAPA